MCIRDSLSSVKICGHSVVVMFWELRWVAMVPIIAQLTYFGTRVFLEIGSGDWRLAGIQSGMKIGTADGGRQTQSLIPDPQSMIPTPSATISLTIKYKSTIVAVQKISDIHIQNILHPSFCVGHLTRNLPEKS